MQWKVLRWVLFISAVLANMRAARAKKVDNPPPEVDKPPVEEPSPSEPTRRAFDVSNYWGLPPLTNDEALDLMKKVKAEGLDGGMALAQWPSLTKQQMTSMREAGMFSDMFVFPTWDDASIRALGRVKDAFDPPCWVWVDLEENEFNPIPDWTEAQLEAAVDNFVDALRVEGYMTGIYTRRSFMQERLPNVDGRKWGPLWDADPDGVPALDPDWKPYNGWERPTWKQYAWNQPLVGMNVDLSVWTL